MVFLFILYALALSDKLNAQHCLDFKYDKSGNRIEVSMHNCGFEYKDKVEVVRSEEISENAMVGDLLVYPNPTDGIFVVDIDGFEEYPFAYYVYNSIGILIQKGECFENQEIDISDNPAGMYLLRIIKGESVCSSVVVKL